MNKLFLLFMMMILFSPVVIKKDFLLRPAFIVWNVGQGQWTTFVSEKTCHHFDMGGEFNPLTRVKELCAQKDNRIYLSHWDWDHISFVMKARGSLGKACLALPPLGKSSGYKMKLLKAYTHCESDTGISVHELTHFTGADLKKKSNDLSHVLIVKNKVLIPGDSTATQEKIWSDDASALSRVRLLVLGHHGSKTSTSEKLLSKLNTLKIAIASARRKRYGHPHFEVVERLHQHRIPLLRTEDWGNIWILE